MRGQAQNKQELVDGILAFWNPADVVKCRMHIRHMRKVVPSVIKLNRAATGH